jgi:hypothetical protein
MMPHQAKSWHSRQLQLIYCSFALAIATASTGCVGERNEFTVPVPAGGAGTVTQPQRGTSQVPQYQQPLAPTINHPMMNDPEGNNQEWTGEVEAKDLSTAEQFCKKLAEQYGAELLKTTQLTKTPDKFGKVKFICWFKSETTGGSYGDDRNSAGN